MNEGNFNLFCLNQVRIYFSAQKSGLVYSVGLIAYFWCPKVPLMVRNTSMRFLEDSRIRDFFATFWKTLFFANFVEVYSVGLNAYFWCPKVPRMLNNTSMRFSEDSRILRCFRHRRPLGKSHFWQI